MAAFAPSAPAPVFLACAERDDARSIGLPGTPRFTEATQDQAARHSLSPTRRLHLRERR